MNTGDNQFELDGFIETETNFGLYGNIWFSQIDFDEDTNIEMNTTIGYVKKYKNRAKLGMGYTKYSDIGNEVSIINDQEEVFIGVDTGPITFAVFYELDSMVPDFLGTINLNYGPLSDIPLDISLLGYIEKENYELSTIVSKVFQKNLSIGYILTWEKYGNDETIKYNKEGQEYSKQIEYEFTGFFNTIYIGFVF
jgi:hypothetical protein|tara:strand:+ start:10177 stop:10761 length:585 start_codon:yes stop_codon:yes gene_type:complete